MLASCDPLRLVTTTRRTRLLYRSRSDLNIQDNWGFRLIIDGVLYSAYRLKRSYTISQSHSLTDMGQGKGCLPPYM